MAATHIADYPQLLSIIESNQKIVYLFGAGASISLGGHRLSWSNWIMAGKNCLNPGDQQELERRIGA